MAFDSIQKYHKIAQEKGLTDANVAANSAISTAAVETAAVNSVWANAKESTSGGTNIVYGEPSTTVDLDSYMKQFEKAAKRVNTIATIQAVGQIAGTLGNIFMGSGIGNNAFGSVTNQAATSSTPATTQATQQQTIQSSVNKTIQNLDLSSDLDSAIAKYNKKSGNEKSTANLNQEISKAQADKSKLASTYAEQTSIINQANTQKAAVDAEIKERTELQKTQQKAVDDAKAAIIKSAEDKIAELDADDKTQNETISASQKKVSEAKTKLDENLAAQDKIISDATPKLQAMKQIQTTDAMGNVTTKQVPDTETRQAAQKAIDEAKAQKEKLQDEFNALKEQEETADNSVQNTAKAKIAENAEARAEQEALKANPQSEELTQLRAALEDIISELSNDQASSNELKNKISQATLTQQTCQQQMTSLSSKIMQAQNLLSQKA